MHRGHHCQDEGNSIANSFVTCLVHQHSVSCTALYPTHTTRIELLHGGSARAITNLNTWKLRDCGPSDGEIYVSAPSHKRCWSCVIRVHEVGWCVLATLEGAIRSLGVSKNMWTWEVCGGPFWKCSR